MAAEHTTVGVQLIEDHVLEILKKLRPARMMGQDSGVQHVRIGQDDVGRATDRAAGVLRRIAVIDEAADRRLLLAQRVNGGVQLFHLVA